MTIQKAIEGAIEGDAWPGYELAYIHDDAVLLKSKEHSGRSKALIVAEILLDPLFWQALGKTEGWTNSTPVNSPDYFLEPHVLKMHRMIDALIDASLKSDFDIQRTIEQYFETL